MVGKTTVIVLESDMCDYAPYMRTIGEKVRLTKLGYGEIISCELKGEKVLTTVKIIKLDRRDSGDIDVYPLDNTDLSKIKT
jgi:hypothetical protein